jgi:hypothetical protein
VLGDSLLAQQTGGFPVPFSHQIPTLPDIDTGQTNQPVLNQTSAFDYPPNPYHYNNQQEEQHQAVSPLLGVSTLDAPLPASFDSNGISYLARNGPWPASMPGAFRGVESPPSSLPKPIGGKFGMAGIRDTANAQDQGSNLGSSPEPSIEPTGARMMHSQRVPRNGRISASLPRHGYRFDPAWEQGDDYPFGYEEDSLPSDLSNLMSPQERARRLSGKVESSSVIREALTGSNTPGDFGTSKVGSPGHAASPSRFTEFFKKHNENGLSSPDFGPVGSPLRSSLHPGASPNLGSSPGMRIPSRQDAVDVAFSISSPPRYSSTSTLSQQLQRTRLASRTSDESTPTLHSSYNRVTSNPRSVFDRAVSSSSVRDRIDEEQPTVFSLDEDDGASTSKSPSSNIWGSAGLKESRRQIVPAIPLTSEKRKATATEKEKDKNKA